MNQKFLMGAGIVVLVIGAGIVLSGSGTIPRTSNTATTTVQTSNPTPEPTTSHSATSSASGTRGVTITAVANFDPSSLSSKSPYPVITGTASVPKVSIIIASDKNVGIVASDIVVKNGHWSYPCSVALKPGLYKIVLSAGNVTAQAPLLIQQP